HEHRPEWRLLPYSSPAQLVRTRALRPSLKVLRLHLIELLLQSLELRVTLGQRPGELADALLLRATTYARRLALFLRLLRRAGREDLIVSRAVAVDRHALAVERVRKLVDLTHILDAGRVCEVSSL